MWTAPASQGDELGPRDQIACVHMSGLLVRSHMNAGQDGLRDVRSKQRCGQAWPLAPSGLLTPWINRSRHLFVLLQGLPQPSPDAGLSRHMAVPILIQCL